MAPNDTSIKVITFDLDDTLWDVKPALINAEQALREWLQQHRPKTLDVLTHEYMMSRKRALVKQQPTLIHQVSALRQTFLRDLQLDCGYNETMATEGAKAGFDVFLAARQQVTPYTDAELILEQLSHTYTLGTLTNGNADIYKTSLGKLVDFAFRAEQVGASKPAPPLFEAALQASGVNAEQIVHVGDNPEHDIIGAKAMGFYTVWFNPQDASWQEGQAPDATISSLTMLPTVLSRLGGGEKSD